MKEREVVCNRCLKSFVTSSSVAKYCPACRKAAYRDWRLLSKIRRRQSKMTPQQRYQEHSLQQAVSHHTESQKLRKYSDKKFYNEVTRPILQQLEDMEKICNILDAYKQEDRVRLLKELVEKITYNHKV